MILINLGLKNFRNIQKINIEIKQKINIIYGGNAQGKTSILEAVYLLGLTKSFRVNDDRSIVKRDKDFYEVIGTFQKTKNPFVVRVYFSSKEGKHIFIDNEKVKKFSSLIGKVPVILLSLEDLELTYGPPSFRRKFIDILISQIDPIYLQSLKQLVKILKHRNKLLTLIKEGNQKETSLLPWDLQLAKFVSYVCLKRREVINELNFLLEDYYKQMAGSEEIVKIQYQTFFDPSLQQQEEIKNYYLQKLTEIKERDIVYGSTTIGAHRDDLVFYKNNAPIKIFGSQGENKTFLISLKFAEANLIKNKINEEPILLLDDIFSELDMSRIQKVIEHIKELNFQTFITTTDVQKFDSRLNDVSLWFVSNGQVSIEA